jgi:putative ABC transport system permease protein
VRFPGSRRRRDRELDEELRSHLRMAIEERVARGESHDAAERAARREFGNLGLVRETTREMWGGGWLERLVQDARYGARTLRKSPGFALVAGLTLALGVGATTAVFTVVHGVLLRPLPYPHPERLVLVSHQPANNPWWSEPGLADHDWLAFRSRAQLFERVAASITHLVTLTDVGEPARLQSARVTAEFFQTLGIQIPIGRAFGRDEEGQGRDHVVLLSDALWRERFGGDPGALGRSVTLDGIAHRVIGVLPPGFAYPADAQLWRPLDVQLGPGRTLMVSVIGRLKPGITVDQAAASLAAATGSEQRARERRQAFTSQVIPLKRTVVGDAERSLLIFAGAVGILLLIACANVANLLLMRATSRQREMAVRTALGAGRSRLVRQVLTESAMLWLAAGSVGALLSVAGVRALLLLAPAGRIPRAGEVGVSAVALAFALGVSLVTGIAFGLVPALRASRASLHTRLTASSRGVSSRDGRVRSALVLVEIALALVLLAGAGLMLQSFRRMRHVDVGFHAPGLVALTVDLPGTRYPSVERMQTFHRTMLERLAAIPGAASVAAVNFSPLGGSLVRGDFKAESGRTIPPAYIVSKPSVSAGYFRTMGIRLVRGREFTERDDATAPRVAIVSTSVAQQIWPGMNAVGQLLSMSDNPGPGDWLTIVGVVDDVVQERLSAQRDAAIYQPYAQIGQTYFLEHMTFVVRAMDRTEPLVPAMQRVLREVDRTQPAGTIQTMDATISATVAEPLFQARLIGAFSAFALLLAGIGIYGVVAYSVAERTHEIGIRVALGADRGHVVWLVLRRILMLVAPGVALGLAGALAVTRVLTTLLFGVKPNDPATLAAVAALLVGVAFVAGVIPARRASRVDPLVALRSGG